MATPPEFGSCTAKSVSLVKPYHFLFLKISEILCGSPDLLVVQRKMTWSFISLFLSEVIRMEAAVPELKRDHQLKNIWDFFELLHSFRVLLAELLALINDATSGLF